MHHPYLLLAVFLLVLLVVGDFSRWSQVVSEWLSAICFLPIIFFLKGINNNVLWLMKTYSCYGILKIPITFLKWLNPQDSQILDKEYMQTYARLG